MSKLKEFYDSLPTSLSPKIEFIREVSDVCGVGEFTVRNWIQGRAKPSDPDHIEILAKATGIPAEELFSEVSDV